MYFGILFAAMMIEANYSYVLFVPLSIFYMFISFIKRNEIKNPKNGIEPTIPNCARYTTYVL